MIRPDRGALALLALVVLGLFRDAVIGGRVFFERDLSIYWHGQTEVFVRAVAGGALPLWDPSSGFGQPMLANPSAQVLYPFTWLNLLLPVGSAYTVYVVAHFLLAAAGLFLLVRHWGGSRPAATAAGAFWIASGPLLSHVSLWHHLAGAAWIPWVVRAAEMALRDPRPRAVAAWAALTALQLLAGSADMCAMGLLLGAAAGARHLRWQAPWHPHNRRRLGAAGLALGLAALIAAAQWLPAAELALRSARRDLPAHMRTYWSVHPAVMAQAVVPVIADELPWRPGVRGVLYESREPFLNSLYLGLATVPLAGAAWAVRAPRSRFLAASLAAAALIALGRHAFVYEALAALAPPLRMLRFPSKAMVPASLCWAALAGLGVEAWRSSAVVARRWLSFVLLPTGAAVALALGAAIVLGRPGGGWAAAWLEPGRATLVSAAALDAQRAVVLGAAALALSGARVAIPGAARLVTVLAVGLAALDLGRAAGGVNPTAPPALLARRPATLDALDFTAGPPRHYAFPYERDGAERFAPAPEVRLPIAFSQAVGYQLYLLPTIARRWGVHGSYGPDALGLQSQPLAAVNALFDAVAPTPAIERLLRAGGVATVTALHVAGLESLPLRAVVPGPFREPIRVLAVPRPLPRVYVVGSARTADDGAALQALADGRVDPEREVLLAPEAAPSVVTPAPAFTGRGRLAELKADRVRIEVEASAPGYVVLLDAHDPGWRATVDGASTAVLRANVAFRAVPVAAGRHLVELVYRPRPVVVGVLLSGLGLAGTAAVAARRRRLAAS